MDALWFYDIKMVDSDYVILMVSSKLLFQLCNEGDLGANVARMKLSGWGLGSRFSPKTFSECYLCCNILMCSHAAIGIM